LRPYLDEVWEQAERGATWIITRYRDKTQNLRTRLCRIIRAAGLTPWPKLWHNLRATRETELAETFPIHVVCAWIGNSKAVANKHYLQVTPEHFERAAAGGIALQMALHSSGEIPCNAMKPNTNTPNISRGVARDCINSRLVARYAQPNGVGGTGLEPATSTV
jgi:hypothetical protein